MKICFFIVFACTLLCVSSFAQKDPVAEVRALVKEEISRSDLVRPSQAKLEIVLDKTEWEIGEPMWPKLVVRTSGDEFDINHGGDYRATGYPQRCKLIVTDAKGDIMPDHSSQWRMGGLMGGERITSEKPFTLEFPVLDYINFTSPGEYEIFSSHDLGWKYTDDHPVVSIKINIVEPTTESASKRVRDLLAGLGESERRSHHIAIDIKCLRHPAYLPGLTRAAEAGVVEAIKGIAVIQSIEAMQTLIKLMASENGEVSLMAAGEVGMRNGLGWDLDEVFWDESLNPLAIEAALDLIQQAASPAHIKNGADIIYNIGRPNDAPAILQALEHSFKNGKPRRSRTDTVSHYPNEVFHLVRAMDKLMDRGYRVDQWSGSVKIAMNFLQIQKAQQALAIQKAVKENPELQVNLPGTVIPMPTGSQWKQSLIAFSDSNPYILRDLAVKAIPSSGSGFEKVLIARSADKDYGVVQSACRKMGETKNRQFIPHLLRIVESHEHPDVVSVAACSASQLGAKSDLGRVLTERLVIDHLSYESLEMIFTIVLGWTSSGGGYTEISSEDRFALRATWREFFNDHHEALDQGKQFDKHSPEITVKLVKPGEKVYRHFDFSDGTSWPVR